MGAQLVLTGFYELPHRCGVCMKGKFITSYSVSIRPISFWLCLRLLKGCKNFVLKFDDEIPTGYGAIKGYTFDFGNFEGCG